MKKQFRIKKSEEFQEIMKFKRFYTSPSLTIYVKPKKESTNRVGISAGKKLGGAVERNKVKRQVRMMVQDCYDFNEEFDTIILIREQFIKESYLTNKNYLETLLKKVKI